MHADLVRSKPTAAPPGAASREGSSAAAWVLTMGARVLQFSVNRGRARLLAAGGLLRLAAPMLQQRAGYSACVLTALTGVT